MIRFEGNLDIFTRGWIVGNFKPALIETKNIEVAIQEYNAGDVEPAHYHKKAIEYNIVLDGVVKFNDNVYIKDNICIIERGDVTEFKAMTDARVLVIKTPSVIGDKYLV